MATPVTLVNDAGTAYSGSVPQAYGGSAAISVTSGNAAAAIATATIPAVSAKTNYITGFDVTGTGATAGLAVAITIAGLAGGSITYTYAAAAGVTVANTPLLIRFPAPIPASAVNTAITVTCPSLGASNTNNVINAFGFSA